MMTAGIVSYLHTLGTAMCRDDSINFTTLSYQTVSTNVNTIHACLQNDGDLDVGRFGNHQNCAFIIQNNILV